jgi:hypothetical protein
MVKTEIISLDQRKTIQLTHFIRMITLTIRLLDVVSYTYSSELRIELVCLCTKELRTSEKRLSKHQNLTQSMFV